MLQERWTQLYAPRNDPLSSASVAIAEHELLSFSVDLYHLKDYLKLAGLAEIEDVVTQTPALARLADLANLEKHGDLSRSPRSGQAPEIVVRRGTSCEGGWRLDLLIRFGPQELDGFDVVSAAMEAWRGLLYKK
jgi:hypothetical protein